MVCQCLALIMGFVSVCLRKWHARVCVCVLQGREHMGEKKKKHIYVQVIIFVTICVCAF